MKKCFKCNEVKVLDCFYKHPSMPDGHVNKCKECNKKDVRENRLKNVDYYRSYDRERGNRQNKEYRDKYKIEQPKKYKAHSMISNAIRDGRLKREDRCSLCSSDQHVHAHHDDYDYPMSVRWLCCICHNKWHKENGEGLNAR
jgi:hypothetical protein